MILKQAQRVANRTFATGGQARDGLSAGLIIMMIRPQGSIRNHSTSPPNSP